MKLFGLTITSKSTEESKKKFLNEALAEIDELRENNRKLTRRLTRKGKMKRISFNDEDWIPSRDLWPEAKGDERLFPQEALALMMLQDGLLFCLRGKSVDDSEKSVIAVCVNCNDLFYWGCADAEELPLITFKDEDEDVFWDFYERYRTKGDDGAVEWCCLRRGMRPQYPVEKSMRDRGVWTEELEALPERND